MSSDTGEGRGAFSGADRALVEVVGVRRQVDLGLLEDPPIIGDWVLIHVGFAMSKISEEGARPACRCCACWAKMQAAMEEVSGYAARRIDIAMKFVDEFRDPGDHRETAEEIRRLADPHRHYRLMEVCGGHTHAIYRFGLKDLLPDNIELVHGPGCPVCVLPMGRIDDGLAMARTARRDLHRLRRHDARARHATAARWNTRRAAWTCASSTRPPTR